MVGVGEEKDRLLESLDFIVHLVCLDVWLELGKVVDGAFAMCGSDNVLRVLPDILGHLAPRGLDGSDRVGEGTVLERVSDQVG